MRESSDKVKSSRSTANTRAPSDKKRSTVDLPIPDAAPVTIATLLVKRLDIYFNKLNILVNQEIVDPLSIIIHESNAGQRGREICKKLKEVLPRQQYKLPIQAAIGGKIIARETIKGFKKDVLTKIHGGGATDRKRKLLDKQKKGKARAKQFGKVEIPQEAFIGVLKINKET